MGFISDFMGRATIDAAAKEMAAQFTKRLPKERADDPKRFTPEFETMAGHARGLQRAHGLGFYGTSRLVNALQWHMIESGYDPEFAKRVGNDLAIRLAASK